MWKAKSPLKFDFSHLMPTCKDYLSKLSFYIFNLILPENTRCRSVQTYLYSSTYSKGTPTYCRNIVRRVKSALINQANFTSFLTVVSPTTGWEMLSKGSTPTHIYQETSSTVNRHIKMNESLITYYSTSSHVFSVHSNAWMN